MRVILGTYRGPELVERALTSLKRHLKGWTSLTIVDDSGIPDWANYYSRRTIELPSGKSFRPKVVSFDRKGYNVAMREVCRQARGERFMFWEEDFELLEEVDLLMLDLMLEERPGLAQIALQRNPVFPNELEVGSMFEALKRRHPERLYRDDGAIIVQDAVFTCNPAVWQVGISERGWPRGRWSEDRFTLELLQADYQFGFLPGILVNHEGVRSGHGY